MVPGPMMKGQKGTIGRNRWVNVLNAMKGQDPYQIGQSCFDKSTLRLSGRNEPDAFNAKGAELIRKVRFLVPTDTKYKNGPEYATDAPRPKEKYHYKRR